jgi:hypothetical protein
MIDNILSNTTKLVSKFLKFKCIFYEFYKFGSCCCAFTGPFANLKDTPVEITGLSAKCDGQIRGIHMTS